MLPPRRDLDPYQRDESERFMQIAEGEHSEANSALARTAGGDSVRDTVT
jgi:hypothetical protein